MSHLSQPSKTWRARDASRPVAPARRARPPATAAMTAIAALGLAAGPGPAVAGPAVAGQGPQDAFLANLMTLCGQSRTGVLVVGDPVLDKDFADKALRLGPVDCQPDRIAIPFAVGEDTSRTWIVTRTQSGVRLKHRHAHGDQEDALSQYGGDTVGPGSATRQDFPADAFTIALFRAENRPASVANVWTLEIEPGQRFSYALRRPGRHVEVAFPLGPDQP